MKTTILGIAIIIIAIVGYFTKFITTTEVAGLIATGIGFILTQDQNGGSGSSRIVGSRPNNR